MSRTFRNTVHNKGMKNSDYYEEQKVSKKMKVKDGTRTRSSVTCEHGGACEYCTGNRTVNKYKTELYSNDDLKYEEI